jgi:glutaredoxin-related protein
MRTGLIVDAVDCADIMDFRLDDLITDHRVLVFASGVTDLRAVILTLDRQELPYRLIMMHMRDIRSRQRFHELCAYTGWQWLPQIFISGEFVGGDIEFFRHPMINPGQSAAAGRRH